MTDSRHSIAPHEHELIIYIDMDATLCDYWGGYQRTHALYPQLAYPQSRRNFYYDLAPMPGAIATFHWLSQHPLYAVYILSAPSILNPHSYTEKRLWVERHLGLDATYRLILSPQKGLLKGHYLIDDNIAGKGQEFFEGQVLQFGSEHYPDWEAIRHAF